MCLQRQWRWKVPMWNQFNLVSFEAGPQRTHEKGSLKYYWWKGKNGETTEKENQAGRSEAGRITQKIYIIINYNTIYKIGLQFCKDLCLGNEDSWAEHFPPPWSWKSRYHSRTRCLLQHNVLGLPTVCQRGRNCPCTTAPLDAPSATFLLESKHTLLNIHQRAVSPSTAGQNQEI